MRWQIPGLSSADTRPKPRLALGPLSRSAVRREHGACLQRDFNRVRRVIGKADQPSNTALPELSNKVAGAKNPGQDWAQDPSPTSVMVCTHLQTRRDASASLPACGEE